MGEDWIGSECSDSARTIKEWRGADRTGRERSGLDRTIAERRGTNRTGLDWTGAHQKLGFFWRRFAHMTRKLSVFLF
jgi:hypothetical protein